MSDKVSDVPAEVNELLNSPVPAEGAIIVIDEDEDMPHAQPMLPPSPPSSPSLLPHVTTPTPDVPRCHLPPFMTDEEHSLVQGYFDLLSSYCLPVRMECTIYFPRHTFPIIPMCETCVKVFCVNWDKLFIKDYVEHESNSFKENLYCKMCRRRLFKFTNV